MSLKQKINPKIIQWFKLIFPLVFITFITWQAYSYFKPKLENLTIQYIESYSTKNLPFKIEIKKLNFSLLYPNFFIEDLKLTPIDEDTQKVLTLPIEINQVQLYIDYLALLSGRIQISQINIKNINSEIDLKTLLASDSKPKAIPFKKIFDIINKIPILSIQVFEPNVKLKGLPQIQDLQIQSQKLTLNKSYNQIQLLTEQGKLYFLPSTQIEPVDFLINLSLNTETIKLTEASLNNSQIQLTASGEVLNIDQMLIEPEIHIKLQNQIYLEKIKQAISALVGKKVPQLAGTIVSDGDIQINGTHIKSQFKSDLKGIQIDQFSIGNVKVDGTLSQNSIFLSEMSVEHPSGKAQFEQTEINLNELKILTHAKVQSLDIQKLLTSLHINEVPVFSVLSGDLPCEVQLKPIYATCKGTVNGRYIQVTEAFTSKQEIVHLENFNLNGKVEVTDQNVSYSAKINLPHSSGSSDGVIDYDEGFNINYEASQLLFSDVKNLVNLRFKGSTSLKGQTQGDSHAATMSLDFNAQDFNLNDFKIGALSGKLGYKSGMLNIQDVKGSLGATQYSGDIALNLSQSTIQTNLQFPFLELSDAQKSIEDVIPIPVQMSGAGSAVAKVWGPLQLNLLSYDVSGSVFKGKVANENYDKFVFDFKSRDGELNVTNTYLQKLSNKITLSGSGHSDGRIDFLVDGKKIKIQDSDNINLISSTLIGNLDIRVALSGLISDPITQIKGQVSEMSIEDTDYNNSFFLLQLSKNNFEGEVNLLGSTITGDFSIPFENRTPLRLNLKTTNFDFISLLSTLTGGAVQNDFKSTITSNINIQSDTGNIFKSTGVVNIRELFIKRQNMFLKNENELSVRFIDGKVYIQNFVLSGPKQKIEITGDGFTSQNLNFDVVASTNLQIIQFLTPFLEDIGGNVQLVAHVKGELFKPEILGTLNSESAYVKFKGFPHPIEKIKSDIIFSHSKILINSIRGVLAGGVLTGDGQVLINGIRDVPTQIRARVEGASFNVPDGIKTTGNAEMTLTGSWFPFVLSGQYFIDGGLVTKEFGEDSSKTQFKSSTYLPKIILDEVFEPLYLDIQAILKKPLPIKNSQLDGNMIGQIQVKGPPENPILIGQVEADKNTKVFFKDKIFEVSNLNVQFNDPTEINPNLFISARSRVEEYEVQLLVQGKAKELQIKLTSIPPLAEPDIISLLAFGITSTRLDQNLSEQQAAQQIGSAIISQNEGIKKIQEVTGLNFQFTSAVDDTKNVAVPKITISRKITPKVSIVGSRTMTGNAQNEVKLNYSLNQNVSTILRWEGQEVGNTTDISNTQQSENTSVFGLDLEYKKEFK